MKRKIIGVIVIILALLMIFSNQINGLYVKLNSKKMTDNVVSKVSAEDMEKNNKTEAKADMWDYSQVRALSVEMTLDQVKERMRKAADEARRKKAAETTKPGDTYTEDYVIGILRIPSVNLEMAVLRGVYNDNLLLGCGTLREDQEMGQGNYPLAGHYSAYDGVLFNRVIDLGPGTMIYLTDKRNIYVYRVYDNVVVPETSHEYIQDSVSDRAGGPVISLMTCYYSGSSGKRVFVQGLLQDVIPYTWEKFSSL